MKNLVSVLVIAAVSGMAAAAPTVVDFDAVALRASNSGSVMPGVTENTAQNGMIASTPLAGQKVYYGTDYFNGWALSKIEEISFTYKPAQGPEPYINLVIANASGDFGIIYTPGLVTNLNAQENRAVYSIAGSTGSFRFYEPYDSGNDGSLTFAHGSSRTWSDFSDWKLIGAGESRPLSSGEGSIARGPLTDGLTILWGDSQANYLGEKEVYDVMIVADGQEYVAGAVVPVPGAFLLGSLGVGCVSYLRRRRSL